MVAQTNRMNQQFQEAMERPAEIVKEYPLASMMLMFGLGLGVGVVMSQAICSSLLELAEPPPTMTDKVGRQIYDALSNVLPPSMLRQMKSYAS
jgi:hypothetical protein